MRDCGVFSPKWNIHIAPLYPRLREVCGKGTDTLEDLVMVSVTARKEYLLDSQGHCTYELKATVSTCMRFFKLNPDKIPSRRA